MAAILIPPVSSTHMLNRPHPLKRDCVFTLVVHVHYTVTHPAVRNRCVSPRPVCAGVVVDTWLACVPFRLSPKRFSESRESPATSLVSYACRTCTSQLCCLRLTTPQRLLFLITESAPTTLLLRADQLLSFFPISSCTWIPIPSRL